MCPEDFEKSQWFQSRHMFIKAPEKGVSICRSKRPKGELVERTYDYVIASRSLQEEVRHMEVVEDFESTPHKALTLLVERVEEFQVWREAINAKSFTRIQWWESARKKQGRTRQRGE